VGPVRSGKTAGVAFGQQSGPPASARQVRELLALLHDAGHSDFRDARGPMGFTQRQAAGKFTSTEAEAFIDGLQNAGGAGNPPFPSPPTRSRPAVAPRDGPGPDAALSPNLKTMRRIPSHELAAELRRRGWTVTEGAGA
jgi:hypothetical protein